MLLWGTRNEKWKKIYIQLFILETKVISIIDALNRQLAHYPYHIGQIVFIGKMILDKKWKSLSITKGKSNLNNAVKFANPKVKQHFTDKYLGKK